MKRLSLVAVSILFALTLTVPSVASAQAKSGTCDAAVGTNPAKIRVSIPIPGVTETVSCTDSKGKEKTIHLAKDIGDYLSKFYRFFVGIVGILATVMVMYGGIRWILAAGNASRISGAKEVITSAIIGVVIAFTSYLLLFLLNPRLVNYDILSGTIGQISSRIDDVDFSRAFKCSDLPNASTTVVEIKDKGLECSVGATTLLSCRDVGSKISAKTVACGSRAEVIKEQPTAATGTQAMTGDQCVGTDCGSAGTCFFEIGRCIPGFLWGKMTWTGNANVVKVALQANCNDGSSIRSYAGIDKPEKEIISTSVYFLDQETDKINYGSALATFASFCTNQHNGLAGFSLLVTVNDDQGIVPGNDILTTDDEYALGKDCKPITTKNPDDISEVEWQDLLKRANLFKMSDFFHDNTLRTLDPFRCDISIDRVAFPAR